MEDVAIVGIVFGTGFLITSMALITNAVKAFAHRRTSQLDDALVTEIKGLREELKQLRQQNNDLLLGVDTTMEAVNRRLTRLESQGRLGAGNAGLEGETQLVARGASSVER